MAMEEWTMGQQVHSNPGQGLPNDSEGIRFMLWQQEISELMNDQTRVLMEIRDILKEEQVAIDEVGKEIMGEVENYIGKHRGKQWDGER